MLLHDSAFCLLHFNLILYSLECFFFLVFSLLPLFFSYSLHFNLSCDRLLSSVVGFALKFFLLFLHFSPSFSFFQRGLFSLQGCNFLLLDQLLLNIRLRLVHRRQLLNLLLYSFVVNNSAGDSNLSLVLIRCYISSSMKSCLGIVDVLKYLLGNRRIIRHDLGIKLLGYFLYSSVFLSLLVSSG